MDNNRVLNCPDDDRAGFVDLTLRLGLPAYDNNVDKNPNQIGEVNLNLSLSNNSYLGQAMQYYHTHGNEVSARYGENNNIGYHNNYHYNSNNLDGFYLGHNNNIGDGVTGRVTRHRSTRRGRILTFNNDNNINVNDANNRRCSNIFCGTVTTPMWRRGPLGPKTLCNACGIKYRKREEKREAARANPRKTVSE